MNRKRLYVSEARAGVESRGDGKFRICIIDEGRGSSGVYQRELIAQESSAECFSGVKSFFDHLEPWEEPHERKVLSLAGKLVGEVAVEEHDGKLGLWSDFEPREEYREFFEQFSQEIAMSIYTSAIAEVDNATGEQVVVEFVRTPYTSVDVVVAAGRGGRFEQATESLTAIRESLNLAPELPAATKAPAEASAVETQGEINMEEMLKEVKALLESLSTALAPVIESANNKANEAEAQASVEEAVQKYAEQCKSIDEADLLSTQAERIKAKALAGEDVAELIAEAKADKDAAVAAVTESAKGSQAAASTFVFESQAGSAKEDWSL